MSPIGWYILFNGGMASEGLTYNRPAVLYNSVFFPNRLALSIAYFMLVSCLAYSSTLKTEAICSTGTYVDFYRTAGIISQEIEFFTNICFTINAYICI
jgi:hypothetical protein